MNKQRILIVIGLLFFGVLALWPARASANVTLTEFKAESVPGVPEIHVEWATATQYDTVGFFVTRSDSSTGTFTRVSDFIDRMGDDLTGWEYDPWIDEDVVLGRTYWYKLEELTTSQESLFYGPISAVAGAVATAIPTATFTPTRTPTHTPSPTATTAAQSSLSDTNPTGSSGSVVAATPRVMTGATVTPRSTSASRSSSPAVAATPLANVLDAQQQPQAVATSAASVPDAAEATVVPPLFAAVPAVDVAQAPDPTLVPPDAVPAVSAPALVVTEAASTTPFASSTNTPVVLLVVAACLFLGIAFLILRQVRQ